MTLALKPHHVIVLGSTNWDMCMYLPRLPKPGDTVGSGTLETAIGGKGANQAAACTRANSDCAFISCVGDDAAADTILSQFNNLGINTSAIQKVSDCATGTALIFIDDAGENCIGLTPGANAHINRTLVDTHAESIRIAQLLLLQLEIPIDAVAHAAHIAHQQQRLVVLNPAPAQPLPDSLLRHVNILTPNRGELAEITGRATNTDQQLYAACQTLLDKGIGAILVTLGADGVLLATTDGFQRFDAFRVAAQDTTAAGDVFNGYLAAELATQLQHLGPNPAKPDLSQLDFAPAIRIAMAAAAIAVTQRGAIPSIPNRDAVEAFLAQH